MQNLEKLAELAATLPAPYKDNAVELVERMGTTIEGIGDKPMEWRPDMLKLVQGTSDRSKLPKGAGIGSFVLGEELVEQPFNVIPLRSWTGRQYWNPDPEQAKMLCNSPDARVGFQYGECKTCPYSKFDEAENKSQCNKTISFLCIKADLSTMFVVNFAKTNYMNGSDWQGLMRKAGVDPFKRTYKLSSVTSTKSKNVELIKAEPAADNKTEAAILEFVKELAHISGEDRKIVLDKFYEYVKNKAANAPALAAPEEGVVNLISDSATDVDDTLVLDQKPATKAPKYSL